MDKRGDKRGSEACAVVESRSRRAEGRRVRILQAVTTV